MEPSAAPFLSALSSTEFDQLRKALAERYSDAKGILGSQLGEFVRQHLTNPDLKGRFGGLKDFVSHYFPAEVVWRGRQGLDDLYDISFATPSSGPDAGTWQRVPPEPSAVLWSAVTNPSVNVQFAWSGTEQSLNQASAGVPLTPNLTAVDKLTKADYHDLSTAFVGSLESIDDATRTQLVESLRSNAEFTNLLRVKDLLGKWEEFRINNAIRVFGDRLGASGAELAVVTRWTEALRSSQQLARSRRLKKAPPSLAIQPSQHLANREQLRNGMPDSRAVATKAMEFLSDSELRNLSLPLGAVMRAIEALIGRS
jgi:hypothetical protein